jgi:uncharacterized protein with von Willebrand factor type A (vWA) domain
VPPGPTGLCEVNLFYPWPRRSQRTVLRERLEIFAFELVPQVTGGDHDAVTRITLLLRARDPAQALAHATDAVAAAWPTGIPCSSAVAAAVSQRTGP